MRIPLLTKKLSNLQVFLQAINYSLFYEASMFSKAFQIFLLNKCHHSSKHLLNKVLLLYTSMIFYSYQILKNTCFNLLNNYILLAQKIILNLLPKNPFFMLFKLKFLGHEIGYNTIKPIHSKITAIHKIPSPTGKVALMSFIGALNFYPPKSSKNSIIISNHFTIYYMKIPLGNGLKTMNVYFKL